MDKPNTTRSRQLTPKELMKDVLIVLLLCSAAFLLWEAQLLVGFSNPLAQTESALPEQTLTYQVQAEAARPIRMAAIVGESGQMYGIQYHDDLVDDLFQLSSNILRETLGSLDSPVLISESEWQSMLSTAPALYFDMAGDVPLSVLAGWLSGQEEVSLTAVPRRFLLTTTEDSFVALSYQTQDGDFYICTTQVVDASRLAAVVNQFSSNGSQFAFQSPLYEDLDPYTMLSSRTPTPLIYTSSNPITTDESRAELLTLLGLNNYGNSIYTSTDGLGIVLRNDTDTLRIYGSGIVTYQGEKGHSLYPIATLSSNPTIFDVAEGCRNLVSSVLAPFCDEARIQLLNIQSEGNRWTVDFCYTLNGAPVQFSDGSDAAQFIVEDGEILEFTLRLRSYTATDDSVILLDQLLATAAMTALGYGGEELILSYYDSGSALTYPDWVASGR